MRVSKLVCLLLLLLLSQSALADDKYGGLLIIVVGLHTLVGAAGALPVALLSALTGRTPSFVSIFAIVLLCSMMGMSTMFWLNFSSYPSQLTANVVVAALSTLLLLRVLRPKSETWNRFLAHHGVDPEHCPKCPSQRHYSDQDLHCWKLLETPEREVALVHEMLHAFKDVCATDEDLDAVEGAYNKSRAGEREFPSL